MSDAVPPSVIVALEVLYAEPEVGDVMATAGELVSLTVTVNVSVAVLPAASRAVTVSRFDPVWRAIAPVLQVAVPLAVPLPPRLLVHNTCVTPMLSDAVPWSVSEEPVATNVEFEVGEVMITAGTVVSDVPTPMPVTTRETVLPLAVKLTPVLTVVVVAGAKRTVTAWVALAPVRVNGLPDTMVNGAPTDALPESVPPAEFVTVKTLSAKLSRFTLPKFTVAVGLTVNSVRATALTMSEQGP